jgi:hypothetical protein
MVSGSVVVLVAPGMQQRLGRDGARSSVLAFGRRRAMAPHMGSLRRWPAWLWLPVYLGSVFVLMGSQKTPLLIAGAASILIALAGALRIALGREPRSPRRGRFVVAVCGLVALYVVCAVLAAPLGAKYAIAALLAGAIPTTAVAILIATARRATVEVDGRLADRSVEDRGPFPVLGLDDATGLGDSPEVHGDLNAHDLPKGHPARRGGDGH